MPTPSTADDVIASLLPRLSAVPGVVAVVLGGSRARGTHRPDSDVDLGLLYHDDAPIDLDALQRLVDEVDDRVGVTVSPVGGWGPWVNGGAWLTVGGVKVDLLYRSIERYRWVIDEATAGRMEHDWLQQPAYGFWSHCYLGELRCAMVLHDPTGVVGEMSARCREYPPALRVSLTGGLSWAARFAVANARGPVSRGDTFAAAGCLLRSLALNAQVLLAVNGEYPMNDKNTVEIISALSMVPVAWSALTARILSTVDLADALLAAETLCEAVEEILGRAGLIRVMPNATAFDAAGR